MIVEIRRRWYRVRSRRREAFSLVELLVVVAIICILAAIVLPNYLGGKDPLSKKKIASPRERAKAVEGVSYIGQINQAIQMYKMDHDEQPPASLSELTRYGVTPNMMLDPNTRQPYEYNPQTGQLSPASVR